MRLPRRSRLSAPFVITVVAMGGCAPEPVVNPPGPPEPHVNPPPPQPQPQPSPPTTSVIHVNPPPPQHPVPDLPAPDDPSQVYKQPDGTCMQEHDYKCPPGVNCNPPPAYPVRCPPGK